MRILAAKKRGMQHLKGTPLSNGLSRGQAYVYSDVLESRQASYNIRKDQFGAEYQRIQNAKESVRRHLFDSAKRIKSAVSRDVADIFIAQESMLVDPQLVDDLKQTLKMRHVNAEQVVGTVFRRWIRKFREAPSQILNQRADDIEDLYRRMMEVLVGIQSHGLERLAPDSIIIARRLLPSDTVFLSQKTCSGILLEIAGQTAHATILAREIGIPCIGQVPGLLQQIETGDELLIDGRTGDITVNPTRKATELFEEARKRNSKSLVLAQRHRFDRSVTADGRAVRILANVGSREDVEAATASGADGIGLFRTEGFFIAAKVLPTTEEYVDYLLHSLEPMGNRSVNLRLLDIGGDKNIP
ncbi:MAG: putative PEP-binding protein, partial [Bacteroidota bacterium]|nr:putative PEP-binding protein [Bacteroidota bacterium]